MEEKKKKEKTDKKNKDTKIEETQKIKVQKDKKDAKEKKEPKTSKISKEEVEKELTQEIQEITEEFEEEHPKKKSIIKRIFQIIFICALLFVYARYIATYGLNVNEYPIKTKELGIAYDGFKIVQFSDLHYGSTVSLKELKNIVKRINDQSPDIIVFTGDLIEQDVILEESEIKDIIEELKKLSPKIETLAVIGNHDYDHDYWNQIVPNLDWIVLDNTYEYVYKNDKKPIVFVGLDDYTKGKPDYNNAFSYLNEIDNDVYTILLLHEPDQIDKVIDYKINLALSGHSHLGQIRLPLFGAIYTPVGSKKYFDEQYKINDTDLYISAGIGTSILKLRFLNPPSINLYRFYTE